MLTIEPQGECSMDFTYHYESPLGGITLASDGASLVGLWFDGQKHFADTLGEHHGPRELPIFLDTVKWLDIYFSGKAPGFTPPLAMRCTEFRQAVWEAMLGIPFGRTMTYGGIASLVARRRGLERMSAQAVGGAVGHNAISLIIPCHRVVGADGSLEGYAGGMERKRKLLALEQVGVEGLSAPKTGAAP